MRKIVLFATIAMSCLSGLQAQNEYRIKQSLPDDIDSIYICTGWDVHLSHDPQASVTIVTTCQAFFEEGSEPEVCTVEGNCLTLLENKTMPKNTRIEIVTSKEIQLLEVGENATLTTESLTFSPEHYAANIKGGAIVTGKTWRCKNGFFLNIYSDANVHLDSIVAKQFIDIYQFNESHFDCPVILSPKTDIERGPRAFGTAYQTDTSLHMTVKTKRILRRDMMALTLSGGIDAPIPLFMNNTQGSPYNRGENYRIHLQLAISPDISLTKNLKFRPSLQVEYDWSRLLNTVSTDGNSLTLDNSFGALNPQQFLLGESMGLDLTLHYSFGKPNTQTGLKPIRLNFGISALMVKGRLVTRTMGSDNRWHRDREKVDVFNPWQLRAHIGIGGGPLTRASLGLTYDLLPTFRSGIGADNLHTFGVSISF